MKQKVACLLRPRPRAHEHPGQLGWVDQIARANNCLPRAQYLLPPDSREVELCAAGVSSVLGPFGLAFAEASYQ